MNVHAIITNPVVKQGSAPDLEIILYDDDGLRIDLDTAEAVSVIFKRWHASDTAIINQLCEITDSTRGECVIPLLEEDTSAFELGRFFGEIQVDFSDGVIERTEDLVLWVKKSVR